MTRSFGFVATSGWKTTQDLYRALKENKNVIGLFIFDSNILDDLDDKCDRRVDFILESLLRMKDALEQEKFFIGDSLWETGKAFSDASRQKPFTPIMILNPTQKNVTKK